MISLNSLSPARKRVMPLVVGLVPPRADRVGCRCAAHAGSHRLAMPCKVVPRDQVTIEQVMCKAQLHDFPCSRMRRVFKCHVPAQTDISMKNLMRVPLLKGGRCGIGSGCLQDSVRAAPKMLRFSAASRLTGRGLFFRTRTPLATPEATQSAASSSSALAWWTLFFPTSAVALEGEAHRANKGRLLCSTWAVRFSFGFPRWNKSRARSTADSHK